MLRIKDIEFQICVRLSCKDLSNLSLVNRYYRDLYHNKDFWRQKIDRDFRTNFRDELSPSSREDFREDLSPSSRNKFYYEEYLNLYKDNPKTLYRIINRPSKYVFLKTFSYSTNQNLDMEAVNEEIKKRLWNLPLLVGDVINLVGEYYPEYNSDDDPYDDSSNDDYYENNRKVIWTGERAIRLSNEVTEYGNLPRIFTFPTFPLKHFEETIHSSNLIWLSPEIIDWLKKKLSLPFIEVHQRGYDGCVEYSISLSELAIKYPHYEDLDKCIFRISEATAKYIIEKNNLEIYVFYIHFYPNIFFVEIFKSN